MSATNNKNKNNSSGTPNKAPKTPSKKKSSTGSYCNGLLYRLNFVVTES